MVTEIRLENLDTLIDHINNELPTCFILTGDLNARCSKWCNNDITNANGRARDTLTSSAGYKQIMNKLTHTLNNSFSGIDLMFRSDLNIISNYGVDISFEKCHHNILFGKIDIRFPLPLSYVREVQDYTKTNVRVYQKLFRLLSKSFCKSFY